MSDLALADSPLTGRPFQEAADPGCPFLLQLSKLQSATATAVVTVTVTVTFTVTCSPSSPQLLLLLHIQPPSKAPGRQHWASYPSSNSSSKDSTVLSREPVQIMIATRDGRSYLLLSPQHQTLSVRLSAAGRIIPVTSK